MTHRLLCVYGKSSTEGVGGITQSIAVIYVESMSMKGGGHRRGRGRSGVGALCYAVAVAPTILIRIASIRTSGRGIVTVVAGPLSVSDGAWKEG